VTHRASTTLTLIIPTYNRATETLVALKSVLNQNFDCTIIIVDDGSEVPFALPDEFIADARIRLVHHDRNRGVSAARNTGLSYCTTRLVTFLDSDDWLLPATLAQRVRFATETFDLNPRDIYLTIGCGWEDSGRATIRMPRNSHESSDFYGGCWVCPGSAVIFHRDLFAAIGQYDESLRRLEDVDLFIRIGQAGGRYICQEIVGVAIGPSMGKSSEDIIGASQFLSETYQKKSGQGTITQSQLRRLRAYLALELAVNAWRSKHVLATVVCLLKSIFLVPRVRLQLVPGWRVIPANKFGGKPS
jgi:glycosyltransferase involved in cell wall biosynthesis